MSDDHNEDPVPESIEQAVTFALERANVIQELMYKTANIPPNDVTVLAVTIIAATVAYRSGLSMNDAFSVYLSTYEQVQHAEGEREVERQAKMVEHLRNAFGRTLGKAFGWPEKKESIN